MPVFLDLVGTNVVLKHLICVTGQHQHAIVIQIKVSGDVSGQPAVVGVSIVFGKADTGPFQLVSVGIDAVEPSGG